MKFFNKDRIKFDDIVMCVEIHFPVIRTKRFYYITLLALNEIAFPQSVSWLFSVAHIVIDENTDGKLMAMKHPQHNKGYKTIESFPSWDIKIERGMVETVWEFSRTAPSDMSREDIIQAFKMLSI